jgi:hypothetical protein
MQRRSLAGWCEEVLFAVWVVVVTAVVQMVIDEAAEKHETRRLVFHDSLDCPGHTTGKPGKRCSEPVNG